jgi:hypothetical protein
MQHFSDEAWVDYVRGTNPLTTAKGMETHLASGCLNCKATLDLWRSVRMIARNENTSTPPENLTRAVRMDFAIRQQPEPQAWTIATLAFDSFLQPAPAGLRSGSVRSRQVVYEAEGFTVDLRFDRQPNSTTICAAGQVLDKQGPQGSLARMAVILWTDKGKALATTEANEFGEFQLEFEQHDQLRLSIDMAGRKTLRIPLGSLE